jgi:hypothetical protein
LGVTDRTLAVVDLDIAEPAWPSMTELKAWPFCSRVIFLAAAVEPLKNPSQFAVISLTAAALPPVDDAGADVVADAVGDGVAGGEFDELEQAASPAIEIPAAVTSRIWRAGR